MCWCQPRECAGANLGMWAGADLGMCAGANLGTCAGANLGMCAGANLGMCAGANLGRAGANLGMWALCSTLSTRDTYAFKSKDAFKTNHALWHSDEKFIIKNIQFISVQTFTAPY